MTRVVHAAEVLALMEKAVEERGAGWVYPAQGDCKYVYDPDDYDLDYEEEMGSEARAMVAYFGDSKAPACLVGKVLFDLNPRFLDEIERTGNNGEALAELHLEHGWIIDGEPYEFTGRAIAALSAGQGVQDSGLPWGDALAKARERAEGYVS